MSAIEDYGRVQEYLHTLVPERSPEMGAMEAYAKEKQFPIIGPVAGYLCYQVARLIGARRAFELGSGYGYSTAWFAKAVQENCEQTVGDAEGVVHHVVWDQELSDMAKEHLRKLGYGEIMRYHVAEAVETLGNTSGPFDLIFNDINKEDYPDSLPVIAEKLRSGGVLIVDNMLWGGRVFSGKGDDTSTEGVVALTDLLVEDPGWIVSLVPIRDGLFIAYKK